MFTARALSFDLGDASQKLYLPKPRTDHLKRSFSYSGGSLWNDLPEDIRTRNLYATLREELINGSLYRTPTWQISKPVNRKFYLR